MNSPINCDALYKWVAQKNKDYLMFLDSGYTQGLRNIARDVMAAQQTCQLLGLSDVANQIDLIWSNKEDVQQG